MPASAQASTITVHASSASVGSRCLENAVWAMPAMAVASWKPTAGLIARSSSGPGPKTRLRGLPGVCAR